MKHPVCYYWRDPATGVEMNFTQDENWGWCIGFPNMDFLEDCLDVLLREAGVEIPWPELSEEEQKKVDANYEKLYEDIRREENEV